MMDRLRTLAVLFAVVAMLSAPATAIAESANSLDDGRVPVVFDALILRPIGFVTMCAGFVGFSLAAPFMAITRPTDMHRPWNSMVVHQARYTFVDPLGFHPDRRGAEARGTVR
jgi:hypothetical protein